MKNIKRFLTILLLTALVSVSLSWAEADRDYTAYATGLIKQPTLQTVMPQGGSTLKLSWQKVTGAKEYAVYQATSKNGTYKKISTTKKNYLTVSGLSKTKTYYYKIRACRNSGFSSYSNIKSGKVMLLKTVKPEEIEAYSGKPYIEVYGNKPSFRAVDLTENCFEMYSRLDSLGRCGITYACVGRETMPDEERGSIGMIKPAGWHTVRYDCIADKYLYNRCHLIGYQLTGENANERNLITGTRYMNVEGMLPLENMVANYIKKTGNHVLYRVTPVYEGDNLLATGVQIEAYSVEDKGKGVCCNVFVYNVQPGIKIDYRTGDSSMISNSGDSSANDNAAGDENADSKNPISDTYVLNTNTKKFHYTSCSSVKDMSEKNKRIYKGNREDIINEGYEPCKRCNP